MLLGYRPELVASRLGLRPIPEHRVLLAGARDLDPPEVAYLEGAGIRRAEVVGLAATPLPDGPLYVHLDLDVIDPVGVPGLRFPAPGGPNSTQVTAALGALLATGRVAAVGIACTWHPGHDAAAAVGARLESVLAVGT
jgi:arginase